MEKEARWLFRGQLVLWVLKSLKEGQKEGKAGDWRKRKLVVMELGFPVMASVGGPNMEETPTPEKLGRPEGRDSSLRQERD